MIRYDSGESKIVNGNWEGGERSDSNDTDQVFMDYITKSSNSDFSITMSIFEGKAIDNQDARGKRFLIVMVTKGSGMAKLNELSVPYIAPCVFCINEKEHFVIPKSEKNEIKAIFFAPSTINSLLDFDKVRSMPQNSPTTMYLDSDLVKSFLIRNEGYHGKYSMGTISEKKMLYLYFQIKKIVNEQAVTWPCRSRSYLFELLFFLDKLYEAGFLSNEVCLENIDDDVNNILLYLFENYDKKITITDITDRFHISKTTLAKLFRTKLNESFLTYLNKLRISIAATMLRDTMLPISEIMTRVGFSDSAHFLRTFKKYNDLSPSGYREKYCWM